MNIINFDKNTPNKSDLENAFEKALSLFLEKRKIDLRMIIKVEWNNRMRSCAGKAFCFQQIIKLNARLLSENESELIPTFLHEVAHLIDFQIRGKSNHDYHWKSILTDMGEKDDRCHNMDVSNLKNKVQKFEVYCNCKTWQFTKNRITKMNRGMSYGCPKCKTAITFNKRV